MNCRGWVNIIVLNVPSKFILTFLFVVRLTEGNCDRYYETDAALQSHWKSKVHKRRVKALQEPAYTIEEAERAAGLGRENKRATSSSTNAQPGPSSSIDEEMTT